MIVQFPADFDWTLLARLHIWYAREVYGDAFERIHIDQIKEEFIATGSSDLFAAKEDHFSRDVYGEDW